jgi:Glycosyltransferase
MVDLQKFKPPHVATKVSDIPEIIEYRKNGLLIEPGDSKSLAAAILEFISDEKLATFCAANGLRYVIEHFSFDDMMEAKLRVDASSAGTETARPRFLRPSDASVLSQLVRPVEMASRDC